MMEEDGQDLLYDMVNASNRLMDLIEKNGGTVVTMDEVIGGEAAATETEGEAAAPGAETAQETPESAPDAVQEGQTEPEATESQTPADGQ